VPSNPPRRSSLIIEAPSEPGLTDAPTTATDRGSSIRRIAGRSSEERNGYFFFPSALSFLAMLNACQPGMPLTPPPACVAHDPWYSPRSGVR
jgi:hypothetical protein